jgi:hypothetical protein
MSYLEPLVLQHALDGSIFTRWRELGLEDDSERAIAHNLALRVLQIPRLAGNAVLHLFANHF